MEVNSSVSILLTEIYLFNTLCSHCDTILLTQTYIQHIIVLLMIRSLLSRRYMHTETKAATSTDHSIQDDLLGRTVCLEYFDKGWHSNPISRDNIIFHQLLIIPFHIPCRVPSAKGTVWSSPGPCSR